VQRNDCNVRGNGMSARYYYDDVWEAIWMNRKWGMQFYVEKNGHRSEFGEILSSNEFGDISSLDDAMEFIDHCEGFYYVSDESAATAKTFLLLGNRFARGPEWDSRIGKIDIQMDSREAVYFVPKVEKIKR